MIAQLGPIADTLKAARKRRGLSQRALAAKAGVPQSHISKIENAAVDLQTTSLIAIARALELELKLVPRQLLPAIQSLARAGEAVQAPPLAGRVDEILVRTAPHERLPEIRRLNVLLRMLRLASLDATNARRLAPLLTKADLLAKRLGTKPISRGMRSSFVHLAAQLNEIRNAVAHWRPVTSPQRSAYSLDDDSDDEDVGDEDFGDDARDGGDA